MTTVPNFRSLMNSGIFIFAILIFFSCSPGSTPSAESEVEEVDTTIVKTIRARPLTDVKFESTPERIARGKYLTEGPLWCFQCHTERDTTKPGWPPIWEKKGSGAVLYKTDSTHLYAPNITPDKKTGAGNFTDDMIARAIREGVGHDGRSLSAMPWTTFREISDEDIASIVSYLRSIPAIENRIPRRKLGQKGENQTKERGVPLTKGLDQPDFSDLVSRGKYLISTADCMGCHTAWYARNPGAFGGGNPLDHNADHIFSPNITSDVTGVGAWPVETFIYVMKNGKGKSGAMSGFMPWTSYKNMSDEDLTAIYQALMTTHPIKHIVQNGVAPTHCEVCGLEHGLGDKNKIEPVKEYKGDVKIPKDLAGAYVSPMYPDTVKISYEKGKLVFFEFGAEWKLFPINLTEYSAEGLLAPIHFIRDEKGNVTDLQYTDLGRSFKKVTTEK
jgi:mono/diheme cytochrome c family protein